MKLYTAIDDFNSEETGNKFLKKGDVVEVLDTSRPEFWLVRRVSRGTEIGFVRATCLAKDDRWAMNFIFLFEQFGFVKPFTGKIGSLLPQIKYFHTTEYISILWHWTKLWKLDFPTFF